MFSSSDSSDNKANTTQSTVAAANTSSQSSNPSSEDRDDYITNAGEKKTVPLTNSEGLHHDQEQNAVNNKSVSPVPIPTTTSTNNTMNNNNTKVHADDANRHAQNNNNDSSTFEDYSDLIAAENNNNNTVDDDDDDLELGGDDDNYDDNNDYEEIDLLADFNNQKNSSAEGNDNDDDEDNNEDAAQHNNNDTTSTNNNNNRQNRPRRGWGIKLVSSDIVREDAADDSDGNDDDVDEDQIGNNANRNTHERNQDRTAPAPPTAEQEAVIEELNRKFKNKLASDHEMMQHTSPNSPTVDLSCITTYELNKKIPYGNMYFKVDRLMTALRNFMTCLNDIVDECHRLKISRIKTINRNKVYIVPAVFPMKLFNLCGCHYLGVAYFAQSRKLIHIKGALPQTVDEDTSKNNNTNDDESSLSYGCFQVLPPGRDERSQDLIIGSHLIPTAPSVFYDRRNISQAIPNFRAKFLKDFHEIDTERKQPRVTNAAATGGSSNAAASSVPQSLELDEKEKKLSAAFKKIIKKNGDDGECYPCTKLFGDFVAATMKKNPSAEPPKQASFNVMMARFERAGELSLSGPVGDASCIVRLSRRQREDEKDSHRAGDDVYATTSIITQRQKKQSIVDEIYRSLRTRRCETKFGRPFLRPQEAFEIAPTFDGDENLDGVRDDFISGGPFFEFSIDLNNERDRAPIDPHYVWKNPKYCGGSGARTSTSATAADGDDSGELLSYIVFDFDMTMTPMIFVKPDKDGFNAVVGDWHVIDYFRNGAPTHQEQQNQQPDFYSCLPVLGTGKCKRFNDGHFEIVQVMWAKRPDRFDRVTLSRGKQFIVSKDFRMRRRADLAQPAVTISHTAIATKRIVPEINRFVTRYADKKDGSIQVGSSSSASTSASTGETHNGRRPLIHVRRIVMSFDCELLLMFYTHSVDLNPALCLETGLVTAKELFSILPKFLSEYCDDGDRDHQLIKKTQIVPIDANDRSYVPWDSVPSLPRARFSDLSEQEQQRVMSAISAEKNSRNNNDNNITSSSSTKNPRGYSPPAGWGGGSSNATLHHDRNPATTTTTTTNTTTTTSSSSIHPHQQQQQRPLISSIDLDRRARFSEIVFAIVQFSPANLELHLKAKANFALDDLVVVGRGRDGIDVGRVVAIGLCLKQDNLEINEIHQNATLFPNGRIERVCSEGKSFILRNPQSQEVQYFLTEREAVDRRTFNRGLDWMRKERLGYNLVGAHSQQDGKQHFFYIDSGARGPSKREGPRLKPFDLDMKEAFGGSCFIRTIDVDKDIRDLKYYRGTVVEMVQVGDRNINHNTGFPPTAVAAHPQHHQYLQNPPPPAHQQQAQEQQQFFEPPPPPPPPSSSSQSKQQQQQQLRLCPRQPGPYLLYSPPPFFAVRDHQNTNSVTIFKRPITGGLMLAPPPLDFR